MFGFWKKHIYQSVLILPDIDPSGGCQPTATRITIAVVGATVVRPTAAEDAQLPRKLAAIHGRDRPRR